MLIRAIDKKLKMCYNAVMIKKAKVFYFFPATYDSETGDVRVIKSWRNGWPLDFFQDLLKVFNLFIEPVTGEHLSWKVWVED